jgi:hypothetical protein
MALCDTVPDEKMIWEYREHLVQAKVLDTLFYRFTRQLEEKKVITYGGSLVDATFVDEPWQRNRREENKTIKEGGIPEELEEEKNKNKRRHGLARVGWTVG